MVEPGAVTLGQALLVAAVPSLITAIAAIVVALMQRRTQRDIRVIGVKADRAIQNTEQVGNGFVDDVFTDLGELKRGLDEVDAKLTEHLKHHETARAFWPLPRSTRRTARR